MTFFFYPQKTRRKSKISGKNRVLLLDGDDLFKAYLIQRVELEIRQPIEIASTSSGIVTDLIESPKECFRKRSKRLSSLRYSLDEVSHLFLPMISLYRGSTALGDPIEDITIEGHRVCLKNLPNGCLIVYIGRVNDSKRLVEDYKRNLELNLGPLLDILENEYGSLKQAKENVTATVTKQIKGERLFSDTIDIRRTVFHRASTHKLLPLVRSICSQLQLFLGSNRCLLLCDKSVLLSTHSAGNDKPLARHLDLKDLQGLISQLVSHPTKLKDPEITQAWLRSKTSLVPFYVNVIRYKMANSLTLVCLHPTKADRFIRLVVLILMQIEQLHTTCELERVTAELTESVNELVIHLQGFVSDSKENSEYPFLRNPLRSAQFFKVSDNLQQTQGVQALWAKLSTDLGKVTEPKTPAKSAKRFSLFSLKSALSSFPLVSSTFSLKNNNGKQVQEIPMKTDVQLAQWRKQILTLLNELCTLAKKDAVTYKLPLFTDSVKRIIKPYIEKLIADHSNKLSEAELKYDQYLRPIDYKLDMLGYSLKDTDKNLELSFETEQLKKDFSNWMHTSPANTHCLDVIGTSGRSYTIYKLCGHRNVSRGSALKSLLNSQSTIPLLPQEITVTAVFDGYVHKELASKQIQSLVKLIRVHLSDSVQFYN